MAEPIQEQILLDIDTTIKAIDATSSGSVYWNTIGANQYLRADAAIVEVENGPFPFIVVAGLDSDPKEGSSAGTDTYWVEHMEVAVVGHISTRTNVHRDMRRLEHDIRQALWVDYTRGALAISTLWTGTELYYPLNNDGRAQVVVNFAIEYEVKLSDLTSTIP